MDFTHWQKVKGENFFNIILCLLFSVNWSLASWSLMHTSAWYSHLPLWGKFFNPQIGKCSFSTGNWGFGWGVIINTNYAFNHNCIHLTNEKSNVCCEIWRGDRNRPDRQVEGNILKKRNKKYKDRDVGMYGTFIETTWSSLLHDCKELQDECQGWNWTIKGFVCWPNECNISSSRRVDEEFWTGVGDALIVPYKNGYWWYRRRDWKGARLEARACAEVEVTNYGVLQLRTWQWECRERAGSLGKC